MEPKQPIITLTTDFGTVDGYVGAMKGVLLNICPQAHLVDITHEIPPQDIRRAAFTLLNCAAFFPAGTIHLVVVDPGVGTPRRPLAVQAGGMTYVGPDNGVFTLVLQGRPAESAVVVENPAYRPANGTVSHTFHGRDLFAPAAAHLAAGVPLDELGPKATDLVTVPFLSPTIKSPDELAGEVVYLDQFGNAVTNLGILEWKDDEVRLLPVLGTGAGVHVWPSGGSIVCRGHVVRLARTYGDVEPSAPLGLIGSRGFLEIAVRDGSAEERLGIQPGDPVVWKRGWGSGNGAL